jgi:hypothetical protein
MSGISCRWLKDCAGFVELAHCELVDENEIIVKVVNSNGLPMLSLYYAGEAQERRCTIRLSLYDIDPMVACAIVGVDNLLALFLVTCLVKRADDINIDTLERADSLVRWDA